MLGISGGYANNSYGANSSTTVLKSQLSLLSLREMPTQYATRPKITFGTTQTMTGAGFVQIGKDDSRISYTHGTPTQVHDSTYPLYLYNTCKSINYGATVGSNLGRNAYGARFQTDAPKFELFIGGYTANLNIWVDGQPLNASHHDLAIPNDGNLDFITVDFGTNTAAIVPSVALVSGGTGHAVGDVITISGGTGTAAQVTVQSVSAGAITSFSVTRNGAYTVLPGAATGSTSSGSGTGATFTLTNYSTTHTTRKMRKIEVIGTDNFYFGGVNLTTLDTIVPYAPFGTRLMVFGDSYCENSNPEFAGGTYPWRVARRLGIDDVWTSGVGATGYLANNGGARMKYRDRMVDITNFKPTGYPHLVLVQGSVNDGGQVPATLQAEVTSFWNALYAALPTAYLLCSTPFNVPTASVPANIAQAIRDGFAASKTANDPTGRRSALIDPYAAGSGLIFGTGRVSATTGVGNSDYYISSDGAHPTQAGHDFIGDWFAQQIYNALVGFS